MPQITDFRASPFSVPRVEATGRFVGRGAYWKLYAIENFFRVLIHSVLSAQIGPIWWAAAVDQRTQRDAERFRQSYLRRPWHTSPGSHEIYYTHLSDLNEIIRANSHLFLPLIPDIDQWIARVEQLRLPRNIVGHMNYPSPVDRMRIDVLHSDTRALIMQLEARGLTLVVP